jgi:aminoglycoside/choline kinase family phosphotransferase
MTDGLDPRGRRMHGWLRDQGIEPRCLQPMGGDASDRRYFRLHTAAGAEIVMDAPDQSRSCEAFCHVRRLMADAGLHVPRIEAVDTAAGFMRLEDLGAHDYLAAMRNGPVDALMGDAVEALVRMQRRGAAASLPAYDAQRLEEELALFPTWYVRRHLGVEPDARWWSRWSAGVAVLVEDMIRQPQVLVHRDYMMRNLLVADPNPGVIDFQDAVAGPVTYDIASLLRDAFFSLDPAVERAWLASYRQRANAAGIPLPADFPRALNRTAAQRHLKVLGVFARLHHRDAKPAYLADAPRFLDYLQRELADDPEAYDLAALVAALPSASTGPRS